MARLDRLATGKPVIQTAAAIGREFTTELLGRICDLNGAALQNALDALVEAGLLVSRQTASGATYVFKHALLQDAAYSSLLRDTRKRTAQANRGCAQTVAGRRSGIASASLRMCEYLARRPELPASGCGESREPICWLGGGRALPARHPRS